jgi:hypothetical protein
MAAQMYRFLGWRLGTLRLVNYRNLKHPWMEKLVAAGCGVLQNCSPKAAAVMQVGP